jgi:hypothetical protein
MAKTRDIGHFYWHTLLYPVKPPVLWEKAETQEIDNLYREGKGYAVRLPFTRHAVVIGKWGKSHNESEALTRAVNGRAMQQDEVDWDTVRFGANYEDL